MSGATGKVKYFEGTPIPTSFVIVCVLCAAASTGALGDDLWFGEMLLLGHVFHPLVLLFALSGSLMIGRLRIPKL
jgi:CDP-diacylglycerol--serine O-phosphatidyltransferase